MGTMESIVNFENNTIVNAQNYLYPKSKWQ